MPDLDDVREIGLQLPGTIETPGTQFSLSVLVKGKSKGLAWTWMERVDPKRKREPNPAVLAIRVPNLEARELLLASNTDVFFTEPHYNGYPAVLVRLDRIDRAELEDLLIEAWRTLGGRDL